jgi:hypothetical protein
MTHEQLQGMTAYQLYLDDVSAGQSETGSGDAPSPPPHDDDKVRSSKLSFGGRRASRTSRQEHTHAHNQCGCARHAHNRTPPSDLPRCLRCHRQILPPVCATKEALNTWSRRKPVHHPLPNRPFDSSTTAPKPPRPHRHSTPRPRPPPPRFPLRPRRPSPRPPPRARRSMDKDPKAKDRESSVDAEGELIDFPDLDGDTRMAGTLGALVEAPRVTKQASPPSKSSKSNITATGAKTTTTPKAQSAAARNVKSKKPAEVIDVDNIVTPAVTVIRPAKVNGFWTFKFASGKVVVVSNTIMIEAVVHEGDVRAWASRANDPQPIYYNVLSRAWEDSNQFESRFARWSSAGEMLTGGSSPGQEIWGKSFNIDELRYNSSEFFQDMRRKNESMRDTFANKAIAHETRMANGGYRRRKEERPERSVRGIRTNAQAGPSKEDLDFEHEFNNRALNDYDYPDLET